MVCNVSEQTYVLIGGFIMTLYTNSQEFDEFSFARERFEDLVMKLRESVTQLMEHGDIEALIEAEGREILRLLFQANLDVRSESEERVKNVYGGDFIERRHCRSNCQRHLTTLFGEVVVRRLGYSGVGLNSIFPQDAKLNLPRDKYSHGLRGRIAEGVAKGAFGEAYSSIKNTTGGHVPKRQIEEVSREIAQDFDAFYCRRSKTEVSKEEILVLSCDSKGITMRHEDLRLQTRKAAEKESHKLQTRLSRGEKRNRKRQATVAAVYSTLPYYRNAKEILNKQGDRTPRPKPSGKRVWASIEKGMETVIEQLIEEALKRDPSQERQWVMLVDGQETQLHIIYRLIQKHKIEVVIVQDFIHVLEYLWNAAYSFYAEGSEEAEMFVYEHALGILTGKISEMAAGIRRSATRRGLSKPKRQAVDKCANYLLKNKERLNYAKALKNGWPIATGVIEGACRHLVKDRMDITGARWSLKGAEAILHLRALHINGDLEDYMYFHKQEEQWRHYEIAA
jgi:hypothetical protein